jgi:hypothetical protein
LDKESLEQVQTGKSLQEEIEGIEEERSIHIQIGWSSKKLRKRWKKRPSLN